MNRFYVTSEQIGENCLHITDSGDIHHIKNVLRLKVGTSVEISDAVQWEYMGIISAFTSGFVEVKILEKQKFNREPKVKVTLYQGIPKQGKMDLIIQKAVELGVTEIVPVFMHRTIISSKGDYDKKQQRYQTIAKEAAAQCGRGIIPSVSHAIHFCDVKEALDLEALNLFLYENEEEKTIKGILRNIPNPPERLALIVGPEGGFTTEEANELIEIGTLCVTLGRRILRTETAGMAGLAMCMYELDLD